MSLSSHLAANWKRIGTGYMIALGGQVDLELRRSRTWDDRANRYATTWLAVVTRTTYHPMSWGGGTTTNEVQLARGLRVADLMASLAPVAAAPIELRLMLLTRHVWPKTAAALMDFPATRDRMRDIYDAA